MLPVEEIYPSLVETLNNNTMALLQAPPGAGKSTWLPLQLIRDNHFKHIILLEPRRLAARNIAGYLAQCQNEKVGQSIGLRIRQEKQVSKDTRLEIVTEGMLTRMLQNDPELTGVDLVIFDEFHERSIAADTALAFALETQSALRDDLKVLLMSATLDAEHITQKLASFDHDCPVITSEGRSYPIDEKYIPLKDETRWLEKIPSIIKQALAEQTGSVLVFLPGQKEINFVARNLNELDADTSVFSLFGEQDKNTQQQAIKPAEPGKRKVVLTTNVAETSLTIAGIRIVIDSGKKRAAKFNLKTGVTELITSNISQSSAVQRAGRAGRIESGIVYRLGSKQTFERRNSHDLPEILSSDISNFVLEAKLWGADINELCLLDKPLVGQIVQAQSLLVMLEAIDENGKLTTIGQKVLSFGADIRLAHMLVKAQTLENQYPGIIVLAVYLTALLESGVKSSNELSIALHSQVQKPHPVFKKQLSYWLKRLKLKPVYELESSYLSILLALAYPDRLAKKRGNGYLLANGAGADLSQDYWHEDEFICIAQMGGLKGSKVFSATPCDMALLEEALPHLFNEIEICEFDEKAGRFIHENRIMLGALSVTEQQIHTGIDQSLRVQAWLGLVKKQGFKIFVENKDAKQLFIRMSLAAKYFPEQYKPINMNLLLDSLETWLAPYLSDIKKLEQLKKFNYLEALKNVFDWQMQSSLNDILPLRMSVPSGSNVRIEYQLDGPAKLAVRMQEVFGLASTPMLAQGKLPLLMELLSPAKRPLQLTQDLATFWQGSYKDIQKEMKGRYPRHFWPDEPATAQATNRIKSKM